MNLLLQRQVMYKHKLKALILVSQVVSHSIVYLSNLFQDRLQLRLADPSSLMQVVIILCLQHHFRPMEQELIDLRLVRQGTLEMFQ